MKAIIVLVSVLSMFFLTSNAKVEEKEKIVLLSNEVAEPEPAVESEPITTTEEEPVQTEEEVFECSVKIVTGKGGDVLVDIEKGHVGDIVTAYIKGDILFNTSSVKINGVSTPISKDGTYKFALVKGENTIEAEFVINNEKLTEIATLINGVKDNGIKSLFTLSNLLNLISWVVTLFLSSGFFITLIKTKTLKAKTTDQIVDVVKATIQSENTAAILAFLNDVFKPSFEKILDKIDLTDASTRTMCKCFILAQEETPESRLAIINELTNLKNGNDELSEQIRAIIKQEQEKQLQQIADRDKALEELKESNDKLVQEEVTESEEAGDSYGQL